MVRASICVGKWDKPSRIGALFNKLRHHSRVASVPTCDPSSDSDAKVEYANYKWDELGFGLIPTDYMYVMNCSKAENSFSEGSLVRFGNMEMNPSSGILNYGQGILEGLKAYRREDEKIMLFRPELNAMRMKIGAERMCMPPPTTQQFLDAIKQTVHANKRWVPPPGKGSMYIRPLLLGSGPRLGVGPASEYTFITYASPVGNYHEGTLNMVVEENIYRATRGGTGCIKAIINYASIYKAITDAKAKGFSDVLFLDAKTGKNLEEASTSNIFIVKGNVISTPATDGTILPGITRKSSIEVARVLGYNVEERAVPVEELSDADEVFLTGTAMVINPVDSVTYLGKRYAIMRGMSLITILFIKQNELRHLIRDLKIRISERRTEYKKGADTVGHNIYEMLTGIQFGRVEDKMGWTVELK
ncbi:hypothetical protein Dsin_024496 [Dipteronia sinensis]|uniref:Branched-chain-amino-acid aminotransferase n=1 Tax=Dipteronia sinensis TaxID=43782 RepID=A0AAE0DWB0_9ROSI|nr:hypothetical protein Dsin_024496 [Dipteronia sinensis]